MSNENDVEIHQGYRELLAQHDLLLIKYKAAQDLVSDIVGFDRDNGVHDVGTMADRIDALLADQMPVPQQTNWPDQCPITRRDFFMEIDGVPTYGGPYDSYTIPEMLGTPDQPWHERELVVSRYDHDLGGWRDDECIPMRIILDDVLWELEEKAEKAVPEGWQLVPVNPTDHMTWVGQSMRYDSEISIGSIYCAMLAAAPKPEGGEPCATASPSSNEG